MPAEPYPESWWYDAFPRTQTASEIAGHPAGARDMLIVVAYDITHPRRLKKVADCCKDFGVRVQYSIFECRLPADTFERFWQRLGMIIDPSEDRLVAYPLHGAAIRRIRTRGAMVCSEAVVSYVF